jgi:HK97 family phage prohead protease
MERIVIREAAPNPTVTGRRVALRVASYDRMYSWGAPPKRERISRGAFTAPLARPAATVLRYRHRDSDSLDDVYGHCVAMAEREGGIEADFEVFPGAREDKLLRLLEGGALSSASMGALVEVRRERDTAGPYDVITRVVALTEVSIVPTAAYDDARVLAVREDPPPTTVAAGRLAAERDWWSTLRT